MKKIFNFSPGPSKLPQSVIDKVEKSVNVLKEDQTRFASVNISTSEYTVKTTGNDHPIH